MCQTEVNILHVHLIHAHIVHVLDTSVKSLLGVLVGFVLEFLPQPY